MNQAAVCHRIASQALEWLAANADRFRLSVDPLSPDVEVNHTLKPLGELAQISLVLQREHVAGSRQAMLARALIDLVWTEFEHGDVLIALLDAEPSAPYVLELYAPLADAGLRNPEFERLAAQTVRTRGWAARELLPARALGVLNVERRLSLPPHANRHVLTRRTWLGQTPEPWTIEHDTAYQVTHTVFHLTNWGERPDDLPEDLDHYLCLWLPSWLAVWREAEHWDLLGELLAVGACLPQPILAPELWADYAEAQQPDGLVPVCGPPPDGDADEVFALCHHPTLVAALAATLATSRAMDLLAAGAPFGSAP